MEKNVNLLSWNKREENLFKIKRYGKFTVMFYRTNDLLHGERVLALLEKLIPYIIKLYPDFNVKKAKLIAKHHDDHEIVLEKGDIPLQLKLMMNEKELSTLEQEELSAIELISQLYPKKIRGYNYKQLLSHAVYKDCVEAQAVSFVDKIDGYCEAIHEVLAGNVIFLEPIINYNLKSFNRLEIKYPLIEKIFELNNNWFNFGYVVDLKDFFENGNIGPKPHTIISMKKYTLIPQYEMWKSVTINKFGIKTLVEQKEFHINPLKEDSDDPEAKKA